MHRNSGIAITTTLLSALAGTAIALAQPGPVVTPPPMLARAAVRHEHNGRDALPDLIDDELSSIRDDISSAVGDVKSHISDVKSHISDVTQALSTIRTGDWPKSSTCWQLYNSLVLTVNQPQPPETNTALASWLASSALHVGGVLAWNDYYNDHDNLLDWVTASDHLIQSSLTTQCDPSITATVTPPPSLSSAWSTWKEHSTSWIEKCLPAARSVIDRCGGVVAAQVEMLLITDADSCTKAVLDLVHAVHGDGSVATTATTGTSEPTSTTGTSEPTPTTGSSVGPGAGGGGDDHGHDDESEESTDTDRDGGGAPATTTGSFTAGFPATTDSTAGAPRETGMAGFAAAAAAAAAAAVAGAVVVGV
ncbi:hypothetical protein VTH82DRAFT_6251 [Thermothelomyces myriococcoides]